MYLTMSKIFFLFVLQSVEISLALEHTYLGYIIYVIHLLGFLETLSVDLVFWCIYLLFLR